MRMVVSPEDNTPVFLQTIRLVAYRSHELGMRRMCRDFAHTLEALGLQHEVDLREKRLRSYDRIGFIHKTELLNMDDSPIGWVVAQEIEGDYAFYLCREMVHVDQL